jgi:hypothetical protein
MAAVIVLFGFIFAPLWIALYFILSTVWHILTSDKRR